MWCGLAMVLLATSPGPDAAPRIEDISRLEEAGKDAEALEVADALVRRSPAWVAPRLEAGRLRLKLGGDLDRAEYDLDVARAIAPENPRAQYLYGLAREERGDDDGALAAYEAAIQLRPAYDEARLRLAGILFARGAWAEAEPHYRIVATSRPDWTHVRLQWVSTLENQGRLEAALEELRRMHAADPAARSVARRLADLYERTGDLQAASSLRQKLDPEAAKKKMRPLRKSRR